MRSELGAVVGCSGADGFDLHQAAAPARQDNGRMTTDPSMEHRMKLDDLLTSDWFGVLGSGVVAALVVALALGSPFGM